VCNEALYVTPGNHDSRKPLADQVRNGRSADRCIDGVKQHYLIESPGHAVFVLDSAPFVEFGESSAPSEAKIGRAGLEWLEERLPRIASGSTAWILTHYPAHNFGIEWMAPRNIMQDGEALHQILVANQSRIGGVFSGHTHNRFFLERDGIKYQSIIPASVPLLPVDTEFGRIITHDQTVPAGFESLILRGPGEYDIESVACDSLQP
jgi:hypothetical protein